MRIHIAMKTGAALLLTMSVACGGEPSVPAGAAAGDEATASDYLAFWQNYFVGEWATKIVAGEPNGRIGVGLEGTWLCRSLPSKACVSFTATTNSVPDYDAIAGYDPRGKAWKEVIFLSDGSLLVQYYTARRADLVGDPVGKVIKGKATYTYPDGRIETADTQFTVVSHDKNEYLATNRRIGEEKRPELKVVGERKRK